MPTSPRRLKAAGKRRRGLSLAELLIAGAIMTLIAGGMGTLAMTMQTANDHCHSQNVAAQHGRVVSARIQAAVRGATASEAFPGCVAFDETIGSYSFPDTLVVWRPLTIAADPTGRPRVSELLLFCPDPEEPTRLLEIRDPSDASQAPLLTNTVAWDTLLADLKSDPNAERVEISDLLRTGNPTGPNGTETRRADLRACVRFNVILAPSAAQWTNYRAGTVTWQALNWPLDLYGNRSGTRQVTCQFELQFDPTSAAATDAQQSIVPCFGSATLTYQLAK